MEQITKEEYKKRLESYKIFAGTRNKELLKSVSFLEVLLDWIDLLIEKKRIGFKEKEQVMTHIPVKTLQKLDEIRGLDVTSYGFAVIKTTLLEETRDLIDFIIKISEIKLEDFDPLQFNLQQIFVKEDITMVLEWARLNLARTIKERELTEKNKIKEQKDKSIKYLNELETKSQKEINKLIVLSMFNFSPSARTDEERKEAIKINKNKMIISQKKGENFAVKLIDATEDAGKEAQMNVFRRIGEARLKMDEVREKFRTRAKQIVSPEGPKKEIGKARKRVFKAKDRINKEKENLSEDLSNAEKMFDRARGDMEEKREDLDSAVGEKRISIKKQADDQINVGKKVVYEARIHLDEETRGADILFEQAREYLGKAEKHMKEEKIGTEKLFSKGRGNLAYAKKHLEDEKSGLEKKQAQAQDIIDSMEDRLNKERARGEQWVKTEKKRIRVIESNLKDRREKEQERLGSIKHGLVTRGIETAGKTKEKLKREISVPENSDILKKVSQKQEFQNKFSDIKNKIDMGLDRKKGLIQYDLRFKRHELRNMAKTQKEAMANKLEAFQEKQKTLVARYRAKRKANMIRTLLKAMRNMH